MVFLFTMQFDVYNTRSAEIDRETVKKSTQAAIGSSPDVNSYEIMASNSSQNLSGEKIFGVQKVSNGSSEDVVISTAKLYEETDSSVIQSVYKDVYSKSATSFAMSTSSLYEATSSTFSLPENTTYGQLNASIYGNTVINLLGNTGDCEDLNRSWTTGNISLDPTSKISGTNSYRLTSVNDNPFFVLHKFNKTDNKYYFLSGSINIKSYTAGIIALRATDSNFTILSEAVANTSIINRYQRIGVKVDASTILDGNMKVIGGSLRTKNTSEANFDGISLVPISESEYNDLTTDQLLEKYPFCNGVQSSKAVRVKSIGENKIKNGNGENDLEKWNYSNTPTFENIDGKFRLTVNNSDYEYIYQNIPVRPYTDYYLSANLIYNSNIRAYATDGVCLREGTGSFNTGQYSSIMVVAHCITPGTGYFSEIMLTEGGSKPISYTSYSENAFYTPAGMGLNSVNQDIKDEIKVDQGRYIKRTDEIYLDSAMQWEGFTNTQFPTITYASVPNWANLNNAVAGTTNMIAGNNDFMFNSTLYFYDNDKPQVAITSDGRLWVAIPKGKIGGSTGYSDDLNGFVKYLTDNKTAMVYQLKQPQMYKASLSPLICYPNGTVFIESVVKNTATYTSTGITVKNKELPVKFIESVYKYEDDLMLPIDMNKVHIASNALSFTIEGAKAGETYEYVYQYDQSLTTLPTIKYSVPTDQSGQINDLFNMLQKQNELIYKLQEELNAIKEDRTVQYEYDSNGRLVRRQKN